MQLVQVGHQIGHPGLEHVLAGGTLSDGVVDFTANPSFQRIWERDIPMSVLEQGIISPLEADPVRARVTLTPLPVEAPTRESNTVNVNQPPVVMEA